MKGRPAADSGTVVQAAEWKSINQRVPITWTDCQAYSNQWSVTSVSGFHPFRPFGAAIGNATSKTHPLESDLASPKLPP
jgi:hypothetical protein